MCWLDRSKCSHLTWTWQQKWECCFATPKKGSTKEEGKATRSPRLLTLPGRFQVCMHRLLTLAMTEKLETRQVFSLGSSVLQSPMHGLDGDALSPAENQCVLPSVSYRLISLMWEPWGSRSAPSKRKPNVRTELTSRANMATGHTLAFFSCP